jgi:hypothetical protein
MTIMLSQPTMVRPRTPEAAAHVPVECGCGQPLDLCHAGHCPRCGVTLHG